MVCTSFTLLLHIHMSWRTLELCWIVSRWLRAVFNLRCRSLWSVSNRWQFVHGSCIPSRRRSVYTFVERTHVHGRRCQVLFGRTGFGPWSLTFAGHYLQRPETRKVCKPISFTCFLLLVFAGPPPSGARLYIRVFFELLCWRAQSYHADCLNRCWRTSARWRIWYRECNTLRGF